MWGERMPQQAIEESFASRVALVAGARGNLGRAVARRLVARGATTVLVDRNGAGLSEAFGDLAAAGTHLLAGDVDVLDASALAAVVAQAVARWGRLDIAINTVGGFRAGEPAHDTALTTWETMFDLNLRSTLALARAVVPTMLKQKQGKMITVAARAALAGSARLAAYSATKAALLRLTESMAAELKSSGINVNCVLPGTLDTPENRRDRPDADFSTWVAPEAVADVILFLVSDGARSVHGAAIPVLGLS
jgi:NAD(P)-dependent dehydrogenase (short-subunit alcohol dehydrogenase family)